MVKLRKWANTKSKNRKRADNKSEGDNSNPKFFGGGEGGMPPPF